MGVVERDRPAQVLDGIARPSCEGLVTGEVVEEERVLSRRDRLEQGVGGGRVVLRLVVDVRAAERLPARPDADKAPERDDRLRVILDPQVADAVDSLARARACAETLDDERPRLLASLVPAGCLPRLERRDEPADEGPERRLEGPRHLVDDGLAGEDVSLHGEAGPGPVPRPVEARRAGE